MTGIVEISDRRKFIFRADVEPGRIWAWDIHDDPGFAGKVTTHKWESFPRGAVVEVFDVDDPPETVGYVPIP